MSDMSSQAAERAPGDHQRPVRQDEPTHRARLVCWHCGAGRDVLTYGPPRFGFEVVTWAAHAGMVGYFDPEHNRALVFCSHDHARQQMTKDGRRFRLRPKREKKTLRGES